MKGAFLFFVNWAGNFLRFLSRNVATQPKGLHPPPPPTGRTVLYVLPVYGTIGVGSTNHSILCNVNSTYRTETQQRRKTRIGKILKNFVDYWTVSGGGSTKPQYFVQCKFYISDRDTEAYKNTQWKKNFVDYWTVSGFAEYGALCWPLQSHQTTWTVQVGTFGPIDILDWYRLG
jgi:hypothetical protein